MNTMQNAYSCTYARFLKHTNVTHAVIANDNVNRWETVDLYVETMLLDLQPHL